MNEEYVLELIFGLGKTLVACTAINLMRQCNPGKKIVFVVSKVPLAFQQVSWR